MPNIRCQCKKCKDGVFHLSDCAVHNEPAEPNGRCNCIIQYCWSGEYRPANCLVCPKCGGYDYNYGETGCDICEIYGEDYKPIPYWKYLAIKAIKE